MGIAFRSADHQTTGARHEALGSVNFILDLVELLANTDRALRLADVAKALAVSKPRVHRHLRALVNRGYVGQDPDTDRYEVTAKLLELGDAVRYRFSFERVVRPVMSRLRDATGQAVTASTLIADKVTIIEMLHARTLIEFGVRPGATLDPFASAHGLIALAFGPAKRIERAWTGPRPADAKGLAAEIARVRSRGWATAADRVLVGVNALAAPIIDHHGEWRGTIAIVGSTSLIPAEPRPAQIRKVVSAARELRRWNP